MRLIAALFIIASCCPATALAIQGSASYHHIDQTRSHRIASADVQRRLSQTPTYQEFLTRRGGSWRVLWDEATGTPVRLSGSGWAVPPARLANDQDVWALGAEILADERHLLGGEGISLHDLEPWTLDRSEGITTLTWRRLWKGLRVIDARISLRFKADRFVMAQFESMPGINLSVSTAVSAQQALATAARAMHWPVTSFEEPNSPELVVLPLLREQSVQYRLAWSLQLRAPALPSTRQVFIDAHSGQFLGWKELLRFMGGQVVGEHDDRFPSNGLTTSPMAHAQLSGSGEDLTADIDGLFSLTASEPIQFNWTVGSEYFDIRALDDNGRAVFSAEFTADGDILIAAVDDDGSARDKRRELAQIDAHISAHTVRDRALQIRPEFAWAQEQVLTRVNDGDSRCNAWFDEQSTLNFVVQGQGCNNTARIADVIYHEYGHGFHLWNIIPGAGSWADGGLAEGLSDYMSATITNSPDLAPGFFRETDAPLRRMDDDYHWPEDIKEDPHQTGLIIASALWHLREGLIAELGAGAGVAHADFLYLSAIRRATDIPAVYDEVLLADDDDGNLSNGTPNQCIIDAAFTRHGLTGQFGSSLAHLTHQPPADMAGAGADIPIAVSSSLANLNCLDTSLGRVTLSWNYDSGQEAFTSQDMDEDAASGSFTGVLPAPPDSRLLRYYIEAFSEQGELLARLPEGSLTDPWYGLWLGPAQTLFSANFEDDSGGFSHALLSESERLGADDWQWGQPQGAAGDPLTAWSGDMVWGNDLAMESNWNGAYQAAVHNMLSSPAIDLPTRAASDRIYVQFRRWLSVEDGFFDQAILSVNGSEVWTQFASTDPDLATRHHQDHHWALRSYEVTDLVADDPTLTIDWQIISDDGLEMGGWTLDDVRVLLVSETAALPLGDDDDDDDRGTGIIAASGCTCSSLAHPTSSKLRLIPLLLLGLITRRRRSSSW